MADPNPHSEKPQVESVEPTPGQEIPVPSGPDGAVTAAQVDDPPETVSASTIMAIFVSSAPFPLQFTY